VGSIPPQCAQMLATLQVPDRDGPIIAATDQPAPIGTHLERLDGPLMRFSHPHALPAVDFPPAQPPVTASTDHQFPTRGPAQRRDHPWMLRKGAHSVPALRIPHEQLPAVSLPLAAAARGQPGAVWAPGHACDGPVMSR